MTSSRFEGDGFSTPSYRQTRSVSEASTSHVSAIFKSWSRCSPVTICLASLPHCSACWRYSVAFLTWAPFKAD